MKKLFKLATMSLAVIVLATGCAMKAEYGIKIDKDKNVKLEIVSAMDNEFIDQSMNMGNSLSNGENNDNTETKTYTDEERWEFLESDEREDSAGNFEGFEKAKYDKDGYKGYTYTKNLGEIDKLIADKDEVVTLDKLGADSKIFTKKGDVYTLNVKVGDDQSKEIEEYGSLITFDAKLKVTLPTKAKSNNATSVDGNTYTWDLTKAKTIELSFDFNNSKSNNIIMIAGCVCAVAAIGICTFVLIKKKQK